MASNFLKHLAIHNKHKNHTLSIRCYGIMELQSKFGEKFKKIQELDLEHANALEKKMHVFISKIQRSQTLNDTVQIHESEIVATRGDAETKSKPNMQKIVQSSYNWNPYEGRGTKNNKNMQHDHLDAIPDEYKQGGWGMQTAPIKGSPQIHKMFPNTDVVKNMVSDGQRVFEMGHLLTNPLREMGYRSANISEGRDYNVLERVLEPFASNIVEEWHGSQAIESQKQLSPTDMDDTDHMFLSKRQLIMRRLKKRAEITYANNESLPPYKYGFEDIPVFIYQTNHHSPDKLGDAKRTRELKVKASVFIKYIFPNMSKAQRTACQLIGGKWYNPKTTLLTLQCTNHYFQSENEKEIMEWMSKLIIEIDRLAEYLANNDADNDNTTWEDYRDRYNDEWNGEVVSRKWNKYRWKQKMLSLPIHLRTNYNLYQNGKRMNKLTKYLDVIYDKTFADAGNILQREGPKKGTANEYYDGYIPKMDEIIGTEIDTLAANPSEFMINKEYKKSEDCIVGKFNIVSDYVKKKRHTFGVNSCYLIPPSDKQFEDVNNAFHMPLAQPFTGLRLRKFKLTPWTNASMMKLYRYERSRIGMKLIFGDEQFKAATVKKIQEVEAEKAKTRLKQQQQSLQMGRKRNRKKYAEKQRLIEAREIRLKQRLQKKANEAEDNPLFTYLGSKKISKQFQSSVTDISM